MSQSGVCARRWLRVACLACLGAALVALGVWVLLFGVMSARKRLFGRAEALHSAMCVLGDELTSAPRCVESRSCAEWSAGVFDPKCLKEGKELECWCPVQLNVSWLACYSMLEVFAGVERNDTGRDRAAWCRAVLAAPPYEQVLTYNHARASWACRRGSACSDLSCSRCMVDVFPRTAIGCSVDQDDRILLGSRGAQVIQAIDDAGLERPDGLYGVLLLLAGLCILCVCYEFSKEAASDYCREEDAEECSVTESESGG
eukprot:TRINITY_DN45854_c0_g1_i1.p1 TRINITY_DN45854_c0_g1~~TRINITY_DN45854_c0_g1_i1.p1  ORF type:complete len:258 (-),score=29.93 TRINITY_DN45854_c0_g1_i1:27-800(-)